ncbi:anti-sigma factor RsiW [Methylobacterium sp. BE186]|uniref:anti-sigma factor family protein n=1 Tax=Methylobacterium sp. BE186 TaxID=2817715 RepID=UPI00286451D0|nr:anti-sigma factor [Methylobacterium sp. BE186]MDR7039760.1 anti-sigma factor RsiW [Methylobacterium sp. BE186]
MTRPDPPLGEDDLQAWIDGRLDPERQEAVQAALADQPELAQRLGDYRATQDALRARLRFKAAEPIPARLRIDSILSAQRRARKSWLSAAVAACLWIVLGGVVGWAVNEFLAVDGGLGFGARSSAVAQEAIDAHRTFAVEVVHPVEVRASEQAHLKQWVTKRLGRSLQIPDLTSLGLYLVGGRVLPAGQNIAAQFMFEDDARNRVTVYVCTGQAGAGDLSFARRGDVQSFYWTEHGSGYAVVSTIDRARLQAVAEQVARQIEEVPEKKQG